MNPLEARGQSATSQIKADEVVQLFPTVAHANANGQSWIVPIHGWIFEPEEDDLLRGKILRELREVLGNLEDQEQLALLEKRLRLFLVDNERGKQVAIRIAGTEHPLPPSEPDGHFFGTVQLPAAAVQAHLVAGRLPFQALLRSGNSRDFAGVAYCLPPTGVSVISDVDDTIKVSNVRNRKELVVNTFLSEYRAVDGMAAVYRKWADSGAAFHYVTASPWQLYQPVDEFMLSSGFPTGTFQMKRVRFKDKSIRELFADPLEHKVAAMGNLIERFPKRTFILVGDSGERDPEVFAALLRQHPDQIGKVCIREVADEDADSPRYRRTFDGLPREKWQVFRDPATLALPDGPLTR